MPREKYESPNPRRTHTIMSVDDINAGKKSQWYELEITGTIKNLSPELWKLQHLTSLYLNDNWLTRIPPEICQLQHLLYLDLSGNKIRALPSELGDLVSLRELLLNNNLLRSLPCELGKLFQLQTLGLKGNPLNPEYLTLFSEPNGTQRLLTYLQDNLHFTDTTPPPRPWTVLAEPERSRPAAMFTVMCYNVLCDKYCTRQLYGYCPSWALNWEYRKKGILDEIKHYCADIISLQEVETEQFYNYFEPELKKEGYEGIFSPKSRARTMTEAERKHVDGCAIFYKTTKFTLLKEHLIEFNQLAMSNAEGSEQMLNRVMTKDNIGLAAMLETKEDVYENGIMPPDGQVRQPIMVATAHIHWDPEFCDVKVVQTLMLMAELKSIIEDMSTSFRPGSSMPQGGCTAMPLLLCGDLNSLPNSGVVEFLENGNIMSNHVDFKDLMYDACLQKLSAVQHQDILSHGFRLAQAYTEEIMPITNYTHDFKGIIDYIFYARDFMRPLGLLGALDASWFRENKVVGCPHPHIPSDHFSLLVELEMPVPYPIFGRTGGGNMPHVSRR